MQKKYLLMVRSFENPNSLSTHRSMTSFFCDLDEVLGCIFFASDTVITLSNKSTGDASAVHTNRALLSYITCNWVKKTVKRVNHQRWPCMEKRNRQVKVTSINVTNLYAAVLLCCPNLGMPSKTSVWNFSDTY